MFHEHVVQSPNLSQARHEDEDSGRVACVGRVLKTYPLKQPDNEVVRYQTLVEKVDSRDSLWRVTLLQGDILLLTRLLVVIFTGGSVLGPVTGLVAVELVLPYARVRLGKYQSVWNSGF